MNLKIERVIGNIFIAFIFYVKCCNYIFITVVWFEIFIAIVFVMMFASSGSSTQESKSSGSSAKTTAAKTSEEKSNDDAKEKTEFGLNETADLDGTHITVTKNSGV